MTSVAAALPPETRKQLALRVLSRTESVTQLAQEYQVSRKFAYQQKQKAIEALERAYASSSSDETSKVLFYLPVTLAWLQQLILGLVLICHSSYGGVVELLRDLFDWPISVGTVHNRVREVATRAAACNDQESLAGIRVGLHDEIFQSGKPVLVGVCAFSTYCCLVLPCIGGHLRCQHPLLVSERPPAGQGNLALSLACGSEARLCPRAHHCR